MVPPQVVGGAAAVVEPQLVADAHRRHRDHRVVGPVPLVAGPVAAGDQGLAEGAVPVPGVARRGQLDVEAVPLAEVVHAHQAQVHGLVVERVHPVDLVLGLVAPVHRHLEDRVRPVQAVGALGVAAAPAFLVVELGRGEVNAAQGVEGRVRAVVGLGEEGAAVLPVDAVGRGQQGEAAHLHQGLVALLRVGLVRIPGDRVRRPRPGGGVPGLPQLVLGLVPLAAGDDDVGLLHALEGVEAEHRLDPVDAVVAGGETGDAPLEAALLPRRRAVDRAVGLVVHAEFPRLVAEDGAAAEDGPALPRVLGHDQRVGGMLGDGVEAPLHTPGLVDQPVVDEQLPRPSHRDRLHRLRPAEPQHGSRLARSQVRGAPQQAADADVVPVAGAGDR